MCDTTNIFVDDKFKNRELFIRVRTENSRTSFET